MKPAGYVGPAGLTIMGTERASLSVMSRRSSPRLTSFDYLGHYRYSLTCCAFRRLPIFTSADTVSAVLDIFRLTAREEAFAIVAYCFMPDYLHLLVTGERATSDLRTFAERAKQRSAFWYRRCASGRLWQRSYWDRVLRNDEAMLAAARYILANPVRAGLVSHPADYPFSGSCVHEREALMATGADDATATVDARLRADRISS